MARFKTGALIILVILSSCLAVLLMMGQPVPGPPAPGEDIWFGPEPNLLEVSLPSRIYIVYSQDEALQVETYSRMYDDLTVTLAQIQYTSGTGGTEWTSGEYTKVIFPPGVLFRYDYQISREMLACWLKMFFETDFPFASIDSIFVPLEPGPVQFINSSTKEVWRLQVSLPWDVLELAITNPRDTLGYNFKAMIPGENFVVGHGVFEIEETEVMVVPAWYGEEVNFHALINSFYLASSLIQEPDGTEIYTDGQQALRIYPSGAVEYTIVGTSGESSLPIQKELMETSLRFISNHGGWPGSILPTELGVRSGQNIYLEFSSIGLGLPVVGDNIGLAVEMNGLAVSGYYRNLIKVRPDKVADYVEILPLSWHLAGPTTQVAKYFSEVDSEITDLALVYYWHQDRLVPTWRTWVDRQIIYVNAVDGRILNIREQAGR